MTNIMILFFFLIIEFYDEVELQIAAYNPKCVTQIKKAFEEFYEIIDNGNQGLKLTDKFM